MLYFQNISLETRKNQKFKISFKGQRKQKPNKQTQARKAHAQYSKLTTIVLTSLSGHLQTWVGREDEILLVEKKNDCLFVHDVASGSNLTSQD